MQFACSGLIDDEIVVKQSFQSIKKFKPMLNRHFYLHKFFRNNRNYYCSFDCYGFSKYLHISNYKVFAFKTKRARLNGFSLFKASACTYTISILALQCTNLFCTRS